MGAPKLGSDKLEHTGAAMSSSSLYSRAKAQAEIPPASSGWPARGRKKQRMHRQDIPGPDVMIKVMLIMMAIAFLIAWLLYFLMTKVQWGRYWDRLGYGQQEL